MNTKGGLASRRGSAVGGGEVGFNFVTLKFGHNCNFFVYFNLIYTICLFRFIYFGRPHRVAPTGALKSPNLCAYLHLISHCRDSFPSRGSPCLRENLIAFLYNFPLLIAFCNLYNNEHKRRPRLEERLRRRRW